MLPSVSVVIPTYRRPDRILETVDAVLAQPALEVVVVVDGCRDGTLEVLEARAATDGRLRPVFVENGGQFRALAVGTEHSRGEVVLALDDDVVARPGLVEGHARHHAGGTAGADGPHLVVLGYMRTRVPSPRRPGQFATFRYADDHEWMCAIYERDPDAVLRDLWGGNFSLRREDALRVGFASPTARGHYHEDRDFGLRCLEAGLRGVFDRTLLADHAHARSLDAFLRDARRRGEGQVALHAAHPELLGPVDVGHYFANMPAPARWAIRAGTVRGVDRVEVAVLRLLIAGAGRVRWWKLELLAAVVAMHVTELSAIRDASGGRLPGRSGPGRVRGRAG